MSKTISIHGLFLLIFLSLLASCIRSPLKKNIILSPIKTEQLNFEAMIDDITVQAYKLSKKETKKLLGTTIEEVAVIQLTIKNNTPVAYEVKKKNIDLEMLPSYAVAHILKKKNKVLKEIALGAAMSAVAVPSFIGYVTGCLTSSPAITLTSLVGGVTAATVSGKAISRSAKNAHKTTCSILQKLSPESLSLLPSTTTSMLLFVYSCQIPTVFNLGLCSTHDQNVTHNFRVALD